MPAHGYAAASNDNENPGYQNLAAASTPLLAPPPPIDPPSNNNLHGATLLKHNAPLSLRDRRTSPMEIPRAYQNLAGVASIVSRLQAGLPMKVTEWWCDASQCLRRTVR